MPYQFESGPTFPYPLRPSVYSEKEGVFRAEKSLDLSEEEKKIIVDFEASLFDELKEIKKISKDTHEVYVDALLTEAGQRMVEGIYKNGKELKNWTKQEMIKCSLDIEDKELLVDVYDAVFQDMFRQENVEDDKDIVLRRFSDIVKEKTGKDEDIRRPGIKVEEKISEDQAINIFANLELKEIPYKWRSGIHDFSVDWARNTIREQYQNSKGDVALVDNPRSICRLENPSNNKERPEKFKDFKHKIKSIQLELGESEEKIDKAKVIVLDIYRKYVNWQIADDLLLWSAAGVEGRDIFSQNDRQIERIDKFIYGVDESFDEKGNRNILTNWMKSKVVEIDNRIEEINEKYFVNSDEAILIANWILKEYGFDKDWKVLKRKTSKGTMGLLPKSKRLNMPKDMDRGLMEFLAKISHEIEGHILSHENSEALEIKLSIMRSYSTGGRDSILEEAGAKNVEDKTWEWISGTENLPESIYFLGIELKKNGGTFRDCLDLFVEMRAKKMGIKKDQIFKDEKTYEQIFNYSYDRAMRLFREHTQLDDNSGRITTSDQLKYLEQNKVTEVLLREGLESVLYVNGFDLYSVKQLLELGVLDETKVRKPKMVIVNKLWPALEKGIKEGKTIAEIVESLG